MTDITELRAEKAELESIVTAQAETIKNGQRLLTACELHNEMLIARLKIAEGAAVAAREPVAMQPMETAPQDGAEVLLKVELRAGAPGRYLVGHYMPGGHCIEDHPPIDRGWYFWDGREFDRAAKPIGWLPLPDATPQPDDQVKEPMVRYCPGCSSVGPVDDGYQDCCPDGSEARMIPRPLAEKCRDTFSIAIRAMMADRAANDAAPSADGQAQHEKPVDRHDVSKLAHNSYVTWKNRCYTGDPKNQPDYRPYVAGYCAAVTAQQGGQP